MAENSGGSLAMTAIDTLLNKHAQEFKAGHLDTLKSQLRKELVGILPENKDSQVVTELMMESGAVSGTVISGTWYMEGYNEAIDQIKASIDAYFGVEG